MTSLAVQSLTFSTPGSTPAFTETKISLPIAKDALLIKITAVGLNPIDIKLTKLALMRLKSGEKGIGRDFAGVVEEVGADLKDKYKVGQRVGGQSHGGSGTLADHFVVYPAKDTVLVLPEEVSNAEAAAFSLTFGTAYALLVDANLTADSRVLVLGGSTAVGLFAIQIAKLHFGVAEVIATGSSRSEKMILDYGADKVINYRDAKYVDEIVAAANEGSSRFQLVADCVGGTDVLFRHAEILEPASKGSWFRSANGDKTTPNYDNAVPWGSLPRMIGRSIFGGYWGLNYRLVRVAKGPWEDIVVKLLEEKKLRIPIDSTYDVSKWQDAWAKLEKQDAHGKIVVTFK